MSEQWTLDDAIEELERTKASAASDLTRQVLEWLKELRVLKRPHSLEARVARIEACLEGVLDIKLRTELNGIKELQVKHGMRELEEEDGT